LGLAVGLAVAFAAVDAAGRFNTLPLGGHHNQCVGQMSNGIAIHTEVKEPKIMMRLKATATKVVRLQHIPCAWAPPLMSIRTDV
jgi:hypothetical protein